MSFLYVKFQFEAQDSSPYDLRQLVGSRYFPGALGSWLCGDRHIPVCTGAAASKPSPLGRSQIAPTVTWALPDKLEFEVEWQCGKYKCF